MVYVQKNKFKVSRRSGSGRGRSMLDEETIPASSPLLCSRVGVVSDFLILRHKLFSYFRSGSRHTTCVSAAVNRKNKIK
jgi:hypothetical protein